MAGLCDGAIWTWNGFSNLHGEFNSIIDHVVIISEIIIISMRGYIGCDYLCRCIEYMFWLCFHN